MWDEDLCSIGAHCDPFVPLAVWATLGFMLICAWLAIFLWVW